MAVDVEIDVALLKSEIKKTYASVSQEPEPGLHLSDGSRLGRRPRLSTGATPLRPPFLKYSTSRRKRPAAWPGLPAGSRSPHRALATQGSRPRGSHASTPGLFAATGAGPRVLFAPCQDRVAR